MTFFGKNDNFQYPTYITSADEMPKYVGTRPSDIIPGLDDINYKHGGQSRFLQTMMMDATKTIPMQRPQNEIGSTRVNHVYPEGAYGNQAPSLTSTSAAPVVPARTNFMRKSTNVFL